jgi:hypothetical protein
MNMPSLTFGQKLLRVLSLINLTMIRKSMAIECSVTPSSGAHFM